MFIHIQKKNELVEIAEEAIKKKNHRNATRISTRTSTLTKTDSMKTHEKPKAVEKIWNKAENIADVTFFGKIRKMV